MIDVAEYLRQYIFAKIAEHDHKYNLSHSAGRGAEMLLHETLAREYKSLAEQFKELPRQKQFRGREYELWGDSE